MREIKLKVPDNNCLNCKSCKILYKHYGEVGRHGMADYHVYGAQCGVFDKELKCTITILPQHFIKNELYRDREIKKICPCRVCKMEVKK